MCARVNFCEPRRLHPVSLPIVLVEFESFKEKGENGLKLPVPSPQRFAAQKPCSLVRGTFFHACVCVSVAFTVRCVFVLVYCPYRQICVPSSPAWSVFCTFAKPASLRSIALQPRGDRGDMPAAAFSTREGGQSVTRRFDFRCPQRQKVIAIGRPQGGKCEQKKRLVYKKRELFD